MKTEELRAIWLDLADAARAASAPENAARIEDRLPALWRARYLADDIRLTEAAKDTAVAGFAAAMRERRARDLETHRNGSVRADRWRALQPLLHSGRSRSTRLVWAGLAATAIFVALLLLNLAVQQRKSVEAHGTGQPKSGPLRTVPENRLIPQPKERVAEHVGSKTSPREKPNLKPEAGHRREPGVLVKRVDVGRFASVMGEPRVTYIGDKASHRALPKMPVTAAMRIETGDADKAEIRFADGSTIALNFNTTVTVPPVQSGQGSHPITASEVSVTSGSISASIAHSEKRGRFAVHTPVATAEVLGTEFSLALKRLPVAKGKGKLSAVLQVQEGRVAFYNDRGRVVAGASTQSTATDGSAPTEPKRLVTLKVRTTADGIDLREHTSPLEASEAVFCSVYPRGTAGLEAVTLPQGEVRIVGVDMGSSVQKAGLRVGDVVVALNGKPIRSAASVRRAIASQPRTRIELTINRKAEKLTIQFETVQAYPRPPMLAPRFAARLYAATWPAINGDSERSLKMLQALANEVQDAAVYNNLGVVLETRDQMGPAIRNYQAAVRLDPRYSLYHSNLGRALKRIGNFERSAEESERAIELDPRFVAAILQLSDTLELLDRNDEALATLELAHSRLSRQPTFWIAKAGVLFTWGRLDEAQDAVSKAIAIDRDCWEAHHLLGMILRLRRRFGEAEASYRRALELNPIGADIENNLGMLLQVLGRLEEAEAALRHAITLEPEHACTYGQLGILLCDTGRFQEAEAMLRKSISLDPKLTVAYIELGVVLKRLGRVREAEAMYRRSIALDPRSPIAYNNLGLLLKGRGHIQEADTLYRKAIEVDPKYSLAYSNLAELLATLDRVSEAEAMYRKAIATDPNVNVYINFGNLLMHTGRVQEAEAMYRKAIDLDSKDPVTYYNLGIVLKRGGRIQEAEAMYRKSIELDPKNAKALTNLGIVLKESGRIQEAEAMFRKAIEADPKLQNAYASLGVLLQGAGRFPEAEASYRKAVALEPKSEYSNRTLAEMLDQLGRLTEAEDVYRAWIRADPKSLYALNCLTWFLADHSLKLEEALEFGKRCVVAAPNDPNPLDTLGWIYYRRKEFDKAEETLKQALALYKPAPDVADVWVHLGLTYEGLRRPEKAIEAYRQALKLQPEHKAAQEALKRLGG